MTFPRNYLSLFIIASAMFISFVLIAQATSRDDITHPTAELGNCKSEAECFRFCDARDNIENVKACIRFAKAHNLLSAEELQEAENFVLTLGITQGPGGCRNQRECDLYCKDTAHLDVCLDFAERYGLRSPEEIGEGRKIASLLKEGAKLPGGCREKNQCMEYCNDSSHMKECVEFGEKAGFISKEEAETAKKILPILLRGEKTPGNCARKEACEAYCRESSHIDECLAFAEKAGLLPPDELAEAKKMSQFIKNGETPGKCARKAECEEYCSDQLHFEECVGFAERAGLIKKEDAELAKKVRGLGPGGCRSLEACEAFCKTPENQEVCIAFAEEHGLDDIASRITEEVTTRQTNEAREKAEKEAETELEACSQKACTEMIACLQEVAKKTGGEGTGEGEGGGLPAHIQSKLTACIEEIKAAATSAFGGEGKIPTPPSSQTPNSGTPAIPPTNPQEEAARQYQEEYQKQYEEEYKKQYEEQVKSQVNCALFEAAPTCSYLGTPGTQNYDLCKVCFPNK